jgi:hypothetical protein
MDTGEPSDANMACDDDTEQLPTQEAHDELSQSESQEVRESKCWGFLQPCAAGGRVSRIDLEKKFTTISLGRNPSNLVTFAGFKISESPRRLGQPWRFGC